MQQVSIADINKFIRFTAKELKLASLPKFHFVGSSENKKNAFGHTKGKTITVRITDRHPVDIMRTVAHEMIHFMRNTQGGGSRIANKQEDEANTLAGRIMRKFDVTHPEVFRDATIRANMLEDMGGMGGGEPANAMGSSSSIAGSGGIDTYDPLLRLKKQPLRSLLKRKMLEPGLNFKKEIKKEK